MTLSIWWIRRDLRLHDNQALHAALQQNAAIVPLYIIDPKLLKSANVGEKRIAFLFGGLRALAEDLAAHGSRLIIRHGEPGKILAEFVVEHDVAHIFAEEDFSPYAQVRDKAIQAHLPLHLTPGLTIHPMGSVYKDDGQPYQVYNPYKKRWLTTFDTNPYNLIAVPSRIPTPTHIMSEAIPETPSLPSTVPFAPGETEASKRLSAFLKRDEFAIDGYAQNRERPDLDGTSQLSPYFALA